MELQDLLARTEPVMRVVDLGECLEWTGARSSDGYGGVWVRGLGMRGAHRIALQLLLETQLDRSVHVLHRCDNPPCINPDHLFTGSHLDNMKDMRDKGRAVYPARWKKLSEEQALEIHRRFVRTGPRQSNAGELAAEYGVSLPAIYHILNHCAFVQALV